MGFAKGVDEDRAGVSAHRPSTYVRIARALNNLALAIRRGQRPRKRQRPRVLSRLRTLPQKRRHVWGLPIYRGAARLTMRANGIRCPPRLSELALHCGRCRRSEIEESATTLPF